MKENNAKDLKNILNYMPDYLKQSASELLDKYGKEVNEIRMRVGKPAVAMLTNKHQFIRKEIPVSQSDISSTFEKICDYSVYSHQNELSHGYITLPGGHRVGICGTAAFDKNGNRTLKYISSLNIRIAGEQLGCSDKIFDGLFSDTICGTLIAGPPCSGKTTLLKDIALKLSSSPYYRKVVVVDEREELASVYRGVPQNSVGEFCDVLSGYPKAEGIINAVRTLSPEIIICDEIGDKADAEAVRDVVNAGIDIISSVHARNADELYRREPIKKLLKSGAFEKIVFLKGGSSRCEPDSVIEVKDYGV